MKMSRLQFARNAVQLTFLGILFAGLLLKIKPVLMVFLPLSLLAGSFFCGWICPFGAVQDLFGKLGSLVIKRKLRMPRTIQKYAQYLRYVLMAALLVMVSGDSLVKTSLNGYMTFIVVAMGRGAQAVAVGIMVGFVVIAMFFDRPFCNYFCSEGIKYGLLSLGRIFTIKRNTDTCVNCKSCDRACPMNIEVSAKDHVRHAQCVNCFECIDACPVNGALTFGSVVKLGTRKRNS